MGFELYYEKAHHKRFKRAAIAPLDTQKRSVTFPSRILEYLLATKLEKIYIFSAPQLLRVPHVPKSMENSLEY